MIVALLCISRLWPDKSFLFQTTTVSFSLRPVCMVLSLKSDEEYSLSKSLVFSSVLFFIFGIKKFKKFVKMKQRNAEE